MTPPVETSTLELALEILNGIEEGSLSAERSLMKASRLARHRRDEVAEEWMALERNGYDPETATTNSGFYESGRAFTEDKFNVYESVPVLAQRAKVLRVQLDQLRLPNVSGEYASIALRETRNEISSVSVKIQRYEGVLSAVEKRVHNYAADVYHATAFSQSVEGVFGFARATIEPMLLEADSDLVRKLDYSARSLADDDKEAVSAATNSLRRLLVVFADLAFAAQEFPRVGTDGKEMLLGKPQYLNRIKAFIDDNCASESR